MKGRKEISGKIVDIKRERIYEGTIVIGEGRIVEIREEKTGRGEFILPGFVDAHVHIESSMLTPVEFGRMALRKGTVGVVADPHEIANVLGTGGIRYMIRESERTPLKVRYGIPSCVPATEFETSGARIEAEEIEQLFKEYPEVHLAEMMNYPGVIHRDPKVMRKIEVARKYDRIVDGHAPGVRGEMLMRYIEAGIRTDHECMTLEEAEEKIALGMHILIREGSAAKNFSALHPLIDRYPDKVMFCTDDIHPDDLMVGHIDTMVRRALEEGHNLWKVLKAAGKNAKEFYRLPIGMLQVGDPADLLIVDNLKSLEIKGVFVNGERIEDVGEEDGRNDQPNRFKRKRIEEKDLVVRAEGEKIHVITAEDGSLYTKTVKESAKIVNGEVVCDTERDLLKIVVVNRYEEGTTPAVGFIKGFGMQIGAIATSIAHDSHNVIGIGANKKDLKEALEAVIEKRGGMAFVTGGKKKVLPLPVAGLMSEGRGERVAEDYRELNRLVQEAGSGMKAPFMTLSFMALLVIPELKIGDKGLFDVKEFKFKNLFA